ncbi:MAG: winged helix-turn-helix transcriptional regulator [Burkholderiales bacterium]|nr:winged helix-turn-helix transcriptional regulator [Phycisphaerae bacterium]
MKLSRPRTTDVDLAFRAFSDRTRLRVLHLLRGGEVCVCDLVKVLDMPQPKVSRHLAYLRRAGLVTARKDGYWMHYSLAPARTDFHKSLLNCLACCCSSVPELAGDAKRLSAACASTATCCG